ncbi:MAG: hypothetical protein JJV94_06885 [Sulfurospirillum sp.]|nr:hypothetical protein [Sulfurospirillum sp.]
MQTIEVAGSTVDFFKFLDGNITVFTFDTSNCQPPEPMVNSMCGLQLLTKSNQRLEMINHKAPMGLFPKIEDDFDYKITKLDDSGKVKVVFTKKENAKNSTDFTQNSCSE